MKKPTRFNPEPTPTEMQLAICLYHLAHGCTYNTIGDLFSIAESTVVVILMMCAKYWYLISMTDLFSCLEILLNGRRNLRTSLKTGNFHVWEHGMGSMCL